MEQEERKHIYFELRKALPIDPEKLEALIRGLTLWLHFTDWNRVFDLDLLMAEGLLEYGSKVYQPDGSWQDHFPPTAYQLTPKAIAILTDTSDWIFGGITNEDKVRKEIDRANRLWLKELLAKTVSDNSSSLRDNSPSNLQDGK